MGLIKKQIVNILVGMAFSGVVLCGVAGVAGFASGEEFDEAKFDIIQKVSESQGCKTERDNNVKQLIYDYTNNIKTVEEFTAGLEYYHSSKYVQSYIDRNLPEQSNQISDLNAQQQARANKHFGVATASMIMGAVSASAAFACSYTAEVQEQRKKKRDEITCEPCK